MLRDQRLYLQDIYDACTKIENYSNSITYREFCNDSKTVDAILHNLMVIGEASKNLSLPFIEKHSQIPWKKIKGLRDIIAHQYFGLDYPLLWDIAKTKVPDLYSAIKQELASL